MAEYRYLAEPDEEWKDFPSNLPPGIEHYSMNRDRVPITPDPRLDIWELEIPVRDGTSITARCYRKTDMQNSLPILVYMHGGGYVTGGLETDDRSCRAVALSLPVLILSLDYRLAPEYKFPTGFQDSFDAVKWVCSTDAQEKLNIDLSKGFILGGTSAGANFTAGISHLLREEKLSYRLTGLVFLAGSFCHPDARPEQYRDRILSIDELDNAQGLTRKSMNYFAAQYGAPPFDKRLSPLLFDSHAGLANKAYFAICGWDPRRDEAILLSQLLQDAGTEIKTTIYPGLPHGFWTTCPDLAVSRSWEADLIEGVKGLLQT